MIFLITGSDANTGADRIIRIQAESERDALAQAKAKGVYPYKCERDKASERAEAERTRAIDEEDRQRREAAERERHIRQQVAGIIAAMRNRLEAGQPVFLYDTVYIPVDSILLDKPLNEGFDIPELRSLGAMGWEVMQVIPRTIGIGLENMSIGSTTGKTWGGGSGGNVVGVRIIIKKSLSLADINDETNVEVFRHIRSNLSSFT